LVSKFILNLGKSEGRRVKEKTKDIQRFTAICNANNNSQDRLIFVQIVYPFHELKTRREHMDETGKEGRWKVAVSFP